jgi:hypothetical protein
MCFTVSMIRSSVRESYTCALFLGFELTPDPIEEFDERTEKVASIGHQDELHRWLLLIGNDRQSFRLHMADFL